jgi:hypothetical protein
LSFSEALKDDGPDRRDKTSFIAYVAMQHRHASGYCTFWHRFPFAVRKKWMQENNGSQPNGGCARGAPALAKGRFRAYDRLNIVRRSRSDKLRRQKKEIKTWIYWPSSAASTCPNCIA